MLTRQILSHSNMDFTMFGSMRMNLLNSELKYSISKLTLLLLLISFTWISCVEQKGKVENSYVIPKFNHDLGHIPFDSKIDDPNFQVCDSTAIYSGRNRLTYQGGNGQLRKDLSEKFQTKEEFKVFSGYIMVRFIHNCEGIAGRFRVEPLNLDFSPADAPGDLPEQTATIVKNLTHWKKSSDYSSEREYSKYINLKINNGKLEYIIL